MLTTTEDLFIISAVSLPPKLLRRTLHQRALRAGRWLTPSELARHESAFLTCIRELYYVNLVHSGGRFYLFPLVLFFPPPRSTPVLPSLLLPLDLLGYSREQPLRLGARNDVRFTRGRHWQRRRSV